VLTAIWAATGTDNYGPGARPISESDIQRESERLRR
jgi:hypothetical protein